MKVLIFGGSGAIGTPIVQQLVQEGIEVYVTSRSKRMSENPYITYLHGNAMNLEFVKSVLKENYDVLMDFMSYSTKAFEERVDFLLSSVGRYFFFSSSRVYADQGVKAIVEESKRLLDIKIDNKYLATDEYALTKARQEDILRNTKYTNWTIIRPYITYNVDRLQLGVFEKEEWLYRALQGRTIVFTKDIAEKVTSLTYGCDTANRIVKLLDNTNSLQKIYHIATEQQLQWGDILNIYIQVLSELLGYQVKCKMLYTSETQGKYSRYWQIKYDRLYNRVFDSSKIQDATGNETFISIQDGLKECLIEFIKGEHLFKIQDICWTQQGYFDRVCGEHTSLKEIPGIKNKIKYLIARNSTILEK